MPTARELLEQADALMRRNRMGTGNTAGRSPMPGPSPPPESPPVSPPAPGLPASPHTIQREPIAPSVARTSLPVDPAEPPVDGADSPLEPRSPAAPVNEPPLETRAEVPLLTDAVEGSTASPGPFADLTDDVPVLTDAVEEIDVGIVDESAQGEPSFWELTSRGETSVLGPAPDSIVVVPLPEPAPPAVPQSPPDGRDPLGLDQPPPSSAGAESTGDEPWEPAATERSWLDEPRRIAADAIEEPPVTEHSWRDESRGIAAEGREEPPSSGLRADEEAPAADESPEALPAEPAPTRSPDPAPHPVSDLDQQQVREIAEEIGMQVLQRIDIYTDTTLRAQLGERLRPVVDRAAADLVAAINEHVGELLRVYISEAIEREIESWRDKGR